MRYYDVLVRSILTIIINVYARARKNTFNHKARSNAQKGCSYRIIIIVIMIFKAQGICGV